MYSVKVPLLWWTTVLKFSSRNTHLWTSEPWFGQTTSIITAKVLMGITPIGLFHHIPLFWRSRASNKHIANNSGLHSLLLPCDFVLADRGFDIGEDVAVFWASVLIPAITKWQDQISWYWFSQKNCSPLNWWRKSNRFWFAESLQSCAKHSAC